MSRPHSISERTSLRMRIRSWRRPKHEGIEAERGMPKNLGFAEVPASAGKLPSSPRFPVKNRGSPQERIKITGQKNEQNYLISRLNCCRKCLLSRRVG